ncbi:MAG: HAD hydrolase family protein [Gracilimonas sp.]|uniref:HAD hydrolase family protein n=1 Tax=Gracilimonas TaxID=649462 RepID=UPI001B201F37|nr:HAD hydrolase family protein [Gracilimonas sp.]MBO6587209.1 HAD hydrolase family protein [Gracilimonas sp.]MBO6614303.1 HAD hydrolase family protein [Gracilimonas sp.]
MIKLFITDLDGCISHPFVSPNWEAVTKIKELNQRSREEEEIPALTICSGRPFPYVECVAQWLDVNIPMVFESGGGMYDFNTNEITWNPHFNDEAKAAVAEIQDWINGTLVKNYKGTYPEFAKYTDVGLVNPDPSKVALMHQEVLNYVPERYPMFEVHATDISVNIILKKANKGVGIRLLCELLEIDLNEVAYIGDSSGDMPGLEIVGKSFAPINAKSFVKDAVDQVTKETTEGVLEAYEEIIAYNRSMVSA